MNLRYSLSSSVNMTGSTLRKQVYTWNNLNCAIYKYTDSTVAVGGLVGSKKYVKVFGEDTLQFASKRHDPLLQATPFNLYKEEVDYGIVDAEYTRVYNWGGNGYCRKGPYRVPTIWSRKNWRIPLANDIFKGYESTMVAAEQHDFDPDLLVLAVGKLTEAFDTATAIGEGKNTFSMIKQTTSRIIDVIRHPRNVLKLVRAENWDEAGNAWLQARYGWRPLIKDMEAVNSNIGSDPFENVLTKSKLDLTQDEQSFERSIDVDGIFRLFYTEVVKTEVIRKATIKALKNLDWSSSDLVRTAYELVPYSFVVDWFINVGAWLEYQRFKRQGYRHTAWLTNIYNVSTRIKNVRCIPYLPNEVSFVSGFYPVGKATYIRRVPFDTSNALLPPLKLRVDFAKTMDLVFMARQLLKGNKSAGRY